MKKNFIMKAAMAACVATLFSSCATIISGTTATVQIDGKFTEPMTVTTSYQTYEDVVLPAEVKVKRQHLDGQHIKITSPNYTYDDIILNRQTNGWAFGNILIGGLIGLGIDLGTNAVSKPGQETYYIRATLKNENGEAQPEKESKSGDSSSTND